MKSPEQLAEERYPYKPSEGGMVATAYAREIVDLKREAYAECLREGAQGIVKEGPSVEDIKKAVEEVLDEHGLEIDGNANVELHKDLVARISALFTQTQVEPNELLEAGNALFAAMRRYEMDVDEEPPYKHREMMARWEKAAQGIAGSSPQRSEDYSGEPGPTKEDAPKNNVEQSEDAALPDGRLSDEEIERPKIIYKSQETGKWHIDRKEAGAISEIIIDDGGKCLNVVPIPLRSAPSDDEIDRLKWEVFPDPGGMRGSSERASEECERESWAKGLRYYRDHINKSTN